MRIQSSNGFDLHSDVGDTMMIQMITEWGSESARACQEPESSDIESPRVLFDDHPKGAPGSECRTYTRLVSPAIGHEKKKMEPPIF